MGEFFNDVMGIQNMVVQPQQTPQPDNIMPPATGEPPVPKQLETPTRHRTDVDDVDASDTKDGMPVFDVEKEEFYQNMNHGRKRIRFKAESPASEYMRKTRYNKPFYIKHGEYMRKIK